MGNVLISMIWPYWQRQAATDEALRLMATHYHDLDLEIIIVDDGSPEPFIPPRWPLNIRVIRLDTKNIPLAPCVPFNRGVEQAKGDYIALSNPETLHHTPVLQAMKDEIDANGPLTYVIAAAWCEEQQRWHSHSSRIRSNGNDVGAYLPPGSDYHFMSMMKRSLWDATGGFDEDYRLGAAFEDADFVRRLAKAGAKFVRRDDLVVQHVRTNARADWQPEAFMRNRALFMTKWKPWVHEAHC